jgi:hypothetical protein
MPFDGFAHVPGIGPRSTIHIGKSPRKFGDAMGGPHAPTGAKVFSDHVFRAGLHRKFSQRARVHASIHRTPTLPRSLSSLEYSGSHLRTGLSAFGAAHRLQSNANVYSIQQRTGDALGVGVDGCPWAIALSTEATRGVPVATRARIRGQDELKIGGHFTAPTGAMQTHHAAFQWLPQ